MLAIPFMDHALLAGGLIALASGVVGYFLVLRNQVFTGDALSHVAFTGALGALALGVDLHLGLYLGCITIAVVMAVLSRRGITDDVTIGNIFSFVLGLGTFFLAYYATHQIGGTDATAGVSVLFGSILGLSSSQTTFDVFVALAVIIAIVIIGRPLLFASIDSAVAEARGMPVRALGVVFLVLVGVTAGEATQAVGALLLLGLLATPAGAAQRLTTHPYTAMSFSAVIALASVWIGLCLSYAQPVLPPSFSILAIATSIYLGSWAISAWRSRVRGSGKTARSTYTSLR